MIPKSRAEDDILYMSLSPRDALAFDINDLRRIPKEDGLYNKETRKKIKEYIDYYKKYKVDAKGAFKKPPKQ
ncbi:hypothetical protein [Paenibacillus glacialis]|uniref:Uncharacterized protein n=1 Tax=Paenibacillus glacialis TaxID=494026 RepID=A0A168H358_9BACL|nr:hypothetical protein [Paenibacillus glacialis]OAB37770.1 hypothetical protein PGLA_20570 [Paenibacillus glacialis]